jgi:hypothetical protein
MLRNESSSFWLWLDLTPMLMCLSGGPKTSGHHRPASRFALFFFKIFAIAKEKISAAQLSFITITFL